MKPLLLLLCLFSLTSCATSKPSSKKSISQTAKTRKELALSILKDPRITLMRKQVSGRSDGASAYDNIRAAARGYAAKRSSYGKAPGGYKSLDIRMLRCMKNMARAGYRFRVTSIAGGSHSRKSRHYSGAAFDVDKINGKRVRSRGCPHWAFRKRVKKYGAVEVLGPGCRGHNGHVHVGFPRK